MDLAEKFSQSKAKPSRLKSFLSNFLRWGLSIALLGYLYHLIDIDKTIAVIKSADPVLVIYAFITFIFVMFLLLIRWFVFVKALGLKVPSKIMTRYFFIGLFGNLFLPSSIGGDVIKIWGVCQYTVEKPKVIASVLIDRLSGFAGIVIVATVAFIFGYRLINDFSLLASIVIMAAVSAGITVVLFNETLFAFCCKIFSAFPAIKQTLMNIHYDIALLKDKPFELVKGAAVSCLCQMITSVIFFLIAKALHQDVSLIYFLIFVPLICVASSLPSIGGLGVREAGTAFLLAKVGVEYGVGVSISLVSFTFMVLMGLIGGLVYFFMKTTPSGIPSTNSLSPQNHTV